jgi:hypothetical protein
MSKDLSILTGTASPLDLMCSYGDEANQIDDIRYGSKGSEFLLLVLSHGGYWNPEYDHTHAKEISCVLTGAGWTF